MMQYIESDFFERGSASIFPCDKGWVLVSGPGTRIEFNSAGAIMRWMLETMPDANIYQRSDCGKHSLCLGTVRFCAAEKGITSEPTLFV